MNLTEFQIWSPRKESIVLNILVRSLLGNNPQLRFQWPWNLLSRLINRTIFSYIYSRRTTLVPEIFTKNWHKHYIKFFLYVCMDCCFYRALIKMWNPFGEWILENKKPHRLAVFFCLYKHTTATECNKHAISSQNIN